MTGFRTYIAAAIIGVVGVLQGVDWVTLISNPKAFGWAALGTGILMAVLRSVTTTPPGASA